MHQDIFAAKISEYLKEAGRTKDTLAKQMGLHPSTFSRKLNSSNQTFFNHAEVKQIIKLLAEWDSFSRQEEVLELLELQDCPDFTAEQWNAPPLKRLANFPALYRTVDGGGMPGLKRGQASYQSPTVTGPQTPGTVVKKTNPARANLKIVPASPALPPCPYRGLFAFREEDAPYFFGRETYSQKLLEAALQKPLVMVVGPSGCGKSSIVFAGLFPPLRTKPDWLLLAFRPTAQPLNSMARALLALLEPDKSEVDRLVEAKKLAENWRKGELTLLEVVERILEKTAKRRLLLVVDQFEELYTLCQEASEQKIYLDLLLTANQPTTTLEQSKLTVVCTLRADFFGYALSYRPLADVLGRPGWN